MSIGYSYIQKNTAFYIRESNYFLTLNYYLCCCKEPRSLDCYLIRSTLPDVNGRRHVKSHIYTIHLMLQFPLWALSLKNEIDIGTDTHTDIYLHDVT